MGAAAGTLAVLGLTCAAPALARAPMGAAPAVSVRVEGATRALLPATTVKAPVRGSITKGGTPSGGCPSASAAGALDAATHHRWGGTYSSGLGIEVTNVLGTKLSYSHGSYWGFYVNGRYASSGICTTKLHAGQQLLFAPVPAKGAVPKPIVLSAPRQATANVPFTVRAYDYPGTGPKTKPVAGVTFAGSSGTTNAKGIATLTTLKPGKLSLVGARRGYIRSAASTVVVHAGR